MNIVQNKTSKAHLPNCMTSYSKSVQKLEHQANANVILFYNDPTYYALCVGMIATQRQQQLLNIRYLLPNSKHPRKLGHTDYWIAIPSSRDQAMSFDVQNKNLLLELAYIIAHKNYTLPQPVKSIFSIQPNGTRKVIIVPIDM